MKRRAQDITETELSVLRLLWDEGPLAARAITEALYPSCSESEVGTVHSLLQRLEKKQFVIRERGIRPHLFSADVTREEFAGRQLKELASRVTGGSLSAFLTHLVDDDSVSNEELKELRRLIDQRTRSSKSRRE